MPNSLTFQVSDPNVTAELLRNKTVRLKFGTQADAEQFIILLSEAARLDANLTLKLKHYEKGKP